MHMPHTEQFQAFSANFILPSPKLDKISLLFGGTAGTRRPGRIPGETEPLYQ